MEAIKADYFVTPTVEFWLEDHEAGPMPQLVKDRNARGLAPPARLAAHGDVFLQKGKQTRALYIFRFLSILYIFIFLIFVHIIFHSIRWRHPSECTRYFGWALDALFWLGGR